MSDESRCPTCDSPERSERNDLFRFFRKPVPCPDPWHAEPVPVQPAPTDRRLPVPIQPGEFEAEDGQRCTPIHAKPVTPTQQVSGRTGTGEVADKPTGVYRDLGGGSMPSPESASRNQPEPAPPQTIPPEPDDDDIIADAFVAARKKTVDQVRVAQTATPQGGASSLETEWMAQSKHLAWPNYLSATLLKERAETAEQRAEIERLRASVRKMRERIETIDWKMIKAAEDDWKKQGRVGQYHGHIAEFVRAALADKNKDK